MPYLQAYAKSMFFRARKFFTGKEEGASMGEYAVLLALVTVALIGVVTIYGTEITRIFTAAGTTLQSVQTP
jgi:Flp pilus assembly pilin Flp